MISLASCDEAAACDAATQKIALLAEGTLMEIAALRLWDAVRKLLPECGADAGRSGGGAIVALCGSGNNAGDALALVRNAVFSGYGNCAAVLCRETRGSLASAHAASLKALGIPVLSWTARRAESEAILGTAGLIVDGLAGTGLKGSLHGPALEALRFVSGLPCRARGGPAIAAVDLPSGLGDGIPSDSEVMRADWTLSVEPRKRALYLPAFRRSVGVVVPVDGVLPVNMRPESRSFLIEASDLGDFLPAERPWHYKGSRGRLAVFAGGAGTTGAASLCARAALASGAGYVALYSEPGLQDILAARHEEVMVRPNPDPAEGFDFSAWDTLLAGPGWKVNEENVRRLKVLLSGGLPAVLDAGAILMYRDLAEGGFRTSAPIILTPHPGECAKLCRCRPEDLLADPEKFLPKLAESTGAHIVFKSHVTWIVAPSRTIRIWDGMECGLGTAGSGDVLAGLVAGLLAREAAAGHADRALDAACAAVLAHGISGKTLRNREGWFVAGRIIEAAAFILGSPAT